MKREERIEVNRLRPNPANPRLIKDEKFEKLVKNLLRYPKFLGVRPMAHKDWVIQGGNMRYKGILHIIHLPLGHYHRLTKEIGADEGAVAVWDEVRETKTIPVAWAKSVEEFTEDEVRAFTIIDNNGFGEWDEELLANEWDLGELEEWGTDIKDLEKKDEGEEEGIMKFSEELDRASNYVVLKFNRDIDFIQIQTLLGLVTTYSRRQNGKPWSAGIGRVVDGVEAIARIKEWGNES